MNFRGLRVNAFGKKIVKEAVCIFSGETTKHEALDALIEAICAMGVVDNREAFRQALFERESIRSTGFKGVAIPHVRIDEISKPTVGVGICKSGIDFDSLDDDNVNIIVLFAMPSGSDKEYLGFLAKVMMALRSGDFCEKLLACDTPEDVAAVLADEE
jgi:mannitol/fructose-specific phosphotransferase system IIA component (Ntr-type)